VDLVFHNAYGPDKTWFYDRALAGGGCLIDLGIHLVDLALWCLDFPAVDAVSARMHQGGRPWDGLSVEDHAAAQLALASGAVVQLGCSWRLPAGCDAVIEASFYGTRGGASLRNVNGSFYDFTCQRFQGTARETLVTPPDAWGGRAAVDWADRLAQGQRFDPEGDRLVELAEVLDRIYAAGRSPR
jgi:predicted dehydrogenase